MSTPAPALVTRSDWGAKPYNGTPSAMESSKHLVVHYSAGPLAPDLSAGKKRVRGIQADHQKKWSDIGYHFLIDSAGHVYQGRPFMKGDSLGNKPVLAIGAHVKNQNTGKIGVCLLGCFHPPYEEAPCTDAIPPAMMDAAVGLLSFLSEAYDVAPDQINGHRDFLATSCPGDTLYAELPAIRKAVKSRLAAGVVKLAEAAAVDGDAVPRGHKKAGSKRYSLKDDGPGLELSRNFRLVEFACKDGSDEVLVHPALVQFLEAVRAAADGKPVHINSGYRTKAYNTKIGGATNSRHVMGMAADIVIKGLSSEETYKIAQALNPGGLGRYVSFTHVDVEGLGRRWDGP